MTGAQQFLKHDRDFDAVRRTEGVELEGMLADWQFLLMRRSGDRAVDAGEASTAGLVPGPDFGRRIGRITSYNVCYTKLLRLPRRCRQ